MSQENQKSLRYRNNLKTLPQSNLMKPKQKKTKQETTAENFFRVDQDDLKNTTTKEVKNILPKEEILKKSIEVKVKEPPRNIEEISKSTIVKSYSPIDRNSLETIESSPKKKKGYKRKATKKRTSKKSKSTTSKQVKYAAPKVLLKKDGYELIITEKPQAALKIASSLGDATKRELNKVPFYELERNGKSIIVACAVGHLFTLKQNVPGSSVPIFDISWTPNFLARKKDFTKRYYDTILKLAKNAGSITVATDFDVEGEVIGLNVVRYLCGQKDAQRMKFSTLTKDELNEAYENKHPSIEWGQAIAGETRHYLDWFYGINLSRALMNAIKTTGKFRIMSIGRVQGPALKFIVDREREIEKFESQPYWQIFITVKDNKNKLELKHIKDIFNKTELKKFENLNGKKAQAETKKREQILPPPTPFNLTDLQREAYKLHGITPSKTLQSAQSLYLAGLISYPRTSSQKLPASIGYKKILKDMAKAYNVESLIKREEPIEGKKTDPAHPSIYPTGIIQILSGNEEKIYNLIARRFLALFCESAIIDDKKVTAIVDGLTFSKKGSVIREKNWLKVYPTKIKEEKIPDMNGEVEIIDSKIEEKETQPPKRYSPSSILTELEKRNLGTKCLAENTIVTFNGFPIKVKELFEQGKITSNEKDIQIREINGKTLSLDNHGEIKVSSLNLISKRKIKENEKIIEIETDYSKVKLTGEHLVYVTEKGEICSIAANNLDLTKKLVCLTKIENYGDVIFEFKDIKKEIKINNKEIKHKFSAKSAKGIKEESLPIKWSSSLAWTLGYYYGDGSYSNPKYNGSHQISFTTTEKKALNLLKKSIKNVFGNEPYCYDLKSKYKVDCNAFISYIFIKMFPQIEGKRPLEISKEFIGDFLKGFFDADGNVHLRPLAKTNIKGVKCNSSDTPRIKITLANKSLIEWISNLLNKLDISNKINKGIAKCNGKSFDCWTILISGRDRVEKFAYQIGFESYKEEILYRGLKCNSQKYNILTNSAKVYLAINNKPYQLIEIINNLKLSRYDSSNSLRRLVNLGLLNKKRKGKGKEQKWTYYIEKPNQKFLNYCIKLIYPKIKEGVYSIPIKGLKEVDYNGFVYDLSVEKDSPNFIAGGNILVHNSTRAAILETLYDRGYVIGDSIKPTSIGISLISTLEKYSPIIIDEELTRNFEAEMEKVSESKQKDLEKEEEKIINQAKEKIIEIAKDFEKSEKKIGSALVDANEQAREDQKIANKLIQCPKCKTGDLAINYSRRFKRYFVACDAYPECKTTFSLPPNRTIKKTDKICPECQYPILMALQPGKKPWFLCFNPLCPTNSEYQKKKEQYKENLEKENNNS